MVNNDALKNEIVNFLGWWGQDDLILFMEDVIPILNTYNTEIEDLPRELHEDERNIRLIRTAYLLSMIAEKHVEKMIDANSRFKGLWKRIETHVEEMENGQENASSDEENENSRKRYKKGACCGRS